MAKGFAKKFYASDAWHRCRDGYIAERVKIDGGMCEMCHRVPGEEVHHVKMLTPGNIQDPEISLNWDNLMYLCRDCHFKVHRELILKGFEQKSRQHILNDRGFYFDRDGRLKRMKVSIIYGSPGSGKTTYVREHMEDSDLVVELDQIEYALGYRRMGCSNLLPLALRIRDMIYQLIEDRDPVIDCRHVWIVATLPKKSDREELAKRVKADELHLCEATQAECEDRVRKDEGRQDKQIELAIIEKWFEDYES